MNERIRQDKIELLRSLLLGNRKRIYTTLKHTSRTGETETISVFIKVDEDLRNVSRDVAYICELPYDPRHKGVVVHHTPFDKITLSEWLATYRIALALDVEGVQHFDL